MNVSVYTGLDPVSSMWWDFWGGPKLKANVRRLNPLASGPHDNSQEIEPICTFCHRVAGECFSMLRDSIPSPPRSGIFGEVPNLRPMSIA